MKLKMLPVGIDDFGKLRSKNYYYVDKTGMIAELMRNLGEVNLFTRPRRFGKTLNMSMLKHFFEIGMDKSLFDDLMICQEKELCETYMGQYPVIFLSLKQVQGVNFQDACRQLFTVIGIEADRYRFLENSDRLNVNDKILLKNLQTQQGNLVGSILQLSKLLYTHYNKKAIILIDEYDVPLQKADEEGYYNDMVRLISQFFGYSMKTNPYMEFAVVTGCMRISKECIFTGFNNPKVHMITDERYDEWFGFTDTEVCQMLAYYNQSEYFAVTKEWYDGYRFGNQHVYCPWDVINWCDKLANTSNRYPENFGANSSGNAMIRRFAELADDETRELLGSLLEGNSVWKSLNFELTYDELDKDVEHLWSVLFMTGYLTYKSQDEAGNFELCLPNREIQNLFREIIEKWFKDRVLEDKLGLKEFFHALDNEDIEALEECINYYLEDSISYLDGGKLEEKENFYHGFMLGILKSRSDWAVRSNREAGHGRLDIVTYPKRGRTAVIFELKYTKDYKDLELAAEAALNQITDHHYDSYFVGKNMKAITHYDIAFCRKRCRVLKYKGSV